MMDAPVRVWLFDGWSGMRSGWRCERINRRLDCPKRGWRNHGMHFRRNDWRVIHRWLMVVMEQIPEGPFPVMQAVPRSRDEWQEWYVNGLQSLRGPSQAVSELIESLLLNPDRIPTVECGRTRYLLRERLRFASSSASFLSDLQSQPWEEDPPESEDPAWPQVLVNRRRWILVDAWKLHGELLWHCSILSAAMATQAMAQWALEE